MDAAEKTVEMMLRLVEEDICPVCGGDLDTGYECNKCGYDALPLLRSKESHGK